MVSPLWKACSDGDLDTVLAVLNDPVDLEEKDHNGATPLVEAVKNGHIEVVRALLNKGADLNVVTSQGRVETYTQDPAIHELLQHYQGIAHREPSHDNVYAHDDAGKGYYAPPPPPPGAYAYYPPMNAVMPPMGDAGVYYSPFPPHPNGDASAGGFGHLPPPDIAKMIPCRYYPACRFGAHCMFAHPGAPFNPPPPHPGQYPPFDPAMGSPYGYYPPPPPQAFQQPNVSVPPQMSPMSPPPGPPAMHGRSPSEVLSPQGAFPNGAPPPPLAMGPYGPMSPTSYPHPGPVPVPMSVPPLAPMHHQPPPPSGPVPQSPTALYHNPPIQFPGHDAHYYPIPPMGYPDADGKPPVSNGQPDGFAPQPGFRDGNGPRRGGAPRRNSFLKQHKPPCIFFPSGRCKNGDDCRFPHVLSENPGPTHPQHYFVPRGGAPRPPRGPHHGNGVAAITQKMGNMNVRDDAPRPQNGATEGSSRSQSTDSGNRPKFHQGPHKNHHHNGMNGRRMPGSGPIKPQRVPSADDFPVLPGSVTPPKRVNGANGPTAAQILSAPAPVKKESSATSTVSTSGSVRARSPEPAAAKEEPPVESPIATPAPEQVHEVTPIAAPASAAQKLPLSFAAAAKTAPVPASAPETPREVSVSA